MNQKSKTIHKVKRRIVVAVSGGFDPVHKGHIELFREAKKLGDFLVVILNNDNWLKKKKGYCFMDQDERRKIIQAIKYVDKVVLTSHEPNSKNMSVSREIERIKPDLFVNGGDKTAKNPNPDQIKACKNVGCKIIYVGGGKIQSSSWLISEFLANYKNREIK